MRPTAAPEARPVSLREGATSRPERSALIHCARLQLRLASPVTFQAKGQYRRVVDRDRQTGNGL